MKKSILLLLLLPMLASAQYFDVFDIDTSSYPIMKAKFFSIDASGKQILNHTPADFEITENGEPRDVISVSCPIVNNEPFSVVLAIDVSGSMSGLNMDLTKKAVLSFIDMLPNDGSEIAITAFNHTNFYVQDFTTNKTRLKASIANLYAEGGTDFDAALITPIAGALLTMEKAKFKSKNVILITDGYANGNENRIINSANTLDCRIFTIVINQNTTEFLKRISNETFDYIITEEEFEKSFIRISSYLLSNPCQITWNSVYKCENTVALEVHNKIASRKSIKRYSLFSNQTAFLDLSPIFLNYGELEVGDNKEATITIKAINRTITIESINFQPESNYYEFLTSLPIVIEKDKSREIKVRYKAIDASVQYSKLNLVTDLCEFQVGVLGGNKNNVLSANSLKITYPNGGEVFNAGIDTVITWEGITKKDTVILKYSTDNGSSWSYITNKASNNKYVWNTPYILGDNYLVSAEQIITSKLVEGDIEWKKSYGQQHSEKVNSAIQSKDGSYIITGSNNSKSGTDLISNTGYEYWIAKFNKDRTFEWEKTFSTIIDDKGMTIIETSDGGYIAVGVALSTNLDEEYFIVKLSNGGDTEWVKFIGSKGNDMGIDILETKDKGFIVLGYVGGVKGKYTNQDVSILKLNKSGILEWEKIFKGVNTETPSRIIPTIDGGYALLLTSDSDENLFSYFIGRNDIWIFKLTVTGDIEWSKCYGNKENNYSKDLIQTFDGGYLMVGYDVSSGFFGDKSSCVYKLDINGKIIWKKNLPVEKIIERVIETPLGEYFLGGNYEEDFWIGKIDNSGNLVYEKTYGGSDIDELTSMSTTNDGGYLLAGNSRSNDGDVESNGGEVDIWLLKLAGPPQILQTDQSDNVFSIIGGAEIVLLNKSIDLGDMIIGKTKDSVVTAVFCNISNIPLHVLGIDVSDGNSGEFNIISGAGDFYLNKDECHDMRFEFAPSSLGNRSVMATIRTTIGDFKNSINIRGRGIDQQLKANSEVLNFGIFELGEGKDTTVVLVKNVGSTPITITDTRISGPDMEQFTLNTTPVTYTIAAGSDKEFKLNYTAKYGGRTSSILEFHYNGIGSPLRSMLFAEGIGGEVYPQVPDAYVGETVGLGIFLGKIKPEGLSEVATNFSAKVSYNSTLLAPIDKSMTVTTEDNKSFIQIAGKLSGVNQIATVPMKVGLGTAIKSGLVITEFQLYDAKGDSVDYEIEPGVGEFNVLGICEEGGTRLLNPNGEATLLKVLPNRTSNQTTVEMTLIESGQTELTIYDQIGNKIATVYSGNPEIGTKEIPLDLSNYANGRYYIKLTTPTITKTEIFEVVK